MGYLPYLSAAIKLWPTLVNIFKELHVTEGSAWILCFPQALVDSVKI